MKKDERTEQDYREAAKNSFSIAGMCRALGLEPYGANYRRIHKAIDKYSIDISHFTGQGWNVGLMFNPNKHRTYSLDEILVKDSKYDNSNNLKQRLLVEGVKERKCEKCGRTEWEGNPIPLQLHHINGERNDNRLENLQILCPNCHAQTDNYCGKNSEKKNRGKLTKKEKYEIAASVYGEEFALSFFGNIKETKKRNKEKKYCEYCGKEIVGKDKHRKRFCSYECSHKAQRKLPNDEIMMQYVKEGKTNAEIALLYNVTETSVRKWKKNHMWEN